MGVLDGLGVGGLRILWLMDRNKGLIAGLIK